MSRVQYVQTVLDGFAASVGQKAFQLDTENRANLFIEDYEFLISYHNDPAELLWISVDIGESPTDKRQLQKVMQHGFSHWALNRMTVALDEQSKHLVAFNAIPICNLDQQTFSQVLKGFYQSLVQFNGFLNEVRSPEAVQ